MSKLYVPEGVWLVCSEGTSTQQLAVVSQSTVAINDGHLMATVEDKVKTDFGCKKGALLTAIAMALCAIAVAAFVVGTGGLGACLIIGAAGAAGAVGGGIIGRLMPCGCASCMGSWKNHSPSVRVCGYYALLEDSISTCSKGGIIKIMFSKEAAEAYAALVAMKSNVEIANVAAIAFALPFILRGAGTAIIGFKGGFSAALAVGGRAAAFYTLGTGITGFVSFEAGLYAKKGVNYAYETAGVDKYIKGKIEDEASTALGDGENQTWMFETKQQAGYIGKIGKRNNYSITNYEKLTYEREGYLSTTKGYVDEKGWEVVEEKSNWKYRVESTRKIEKLPTTDKLTQSSGVYYMRDEYTYKTGKDYNIGKGLAKDLKKSANPFGHMFAIGLLTDLSRGICNKLLEGKLDNYKEMLSAEQQARKKMTVHTK